MASPRPARFVRVHLIAILAGALFGSALFGQADGTNTFPVAIILVRHGEKAAAPADDPALSPAGQERARALLATVRGAGITAVITSSTRRTQETAQPVAEAFGLRMDVVPIERGALAAHVTAVAAAARRYPGGIVLIVGHSNTLPAILKELGVESVPEISEEEFAHFFVVLPGTKRVRFLQSTFGAADAGKAAKP